MANYTATSSVILNGKQAEDTLLKLSKRSEVLHKKWEEFRKAGDAPGMRKIEKEMKSVDKAAAKLHKDTLSVEKVIKNLSGATMEELRLAQKKLNKEMDKMDRNSKEYKEAAKNAKLLNNEIAKAKIQTGQWRSPMQRLLGQAKGLLPAFGFGAIVAGAIKGAKALFNLYQETSKARREAERLTGLSGKPLADFTAGVQATAKTFNKDFNETLVGVNSFAKTMGITVEEALKKVNDGFITGADSSGEYLDILREYGPQFKAAGLSADESIALISQQVKSGIYSDKGIDTIKEATISLREMTPATRAAIDGIGLSSVTMQQQLRDGTISVFDAIQQISNRLAELPPQSSEVGTAIANIFRGAGEDAGLEYITMLGTAEMSLEKLKEGAGENAAVQEKLLEANQKLNQAFGELIGTGTGTFDAIKAFAIDLLANGIAGLSKGIADVRDWFIELYNESLPVRAGFQYMFAMWKTGFTAVKVAVQSLWEQLKLGGKLIKAVLTFDLDGIKEAFREYGENMKTTVADNSQKLAETWKNAWNNTIDGKLKPVKQVVEVETVVSGTGTQPGAAGATQTQDTGVPSRTGTSFEEMETISDPRIKSEEQFTEAVLEETKLRQQALDNEQKAAMDRAATEEQLQQQKREAYLSTLDTIINVFGQESAIGKAALLAKQAYAIAETIINIAKGTGESAAAAPFPANIPLIIGFVGQVAGLIATIEGAGKKTKGYAMGKYPILADDGKTYNAKYAGRPETGFYNGPHYALFNEVPDQPELIVDGATTRNLQINAPGIIRAIYDVRDGRTPRYAEGKYPVPANNNSNENSTGITLDNKIARELISAIHAFTNKKLVVYSEMIKKDIELLNDIENQRNI